MKKSKEVIRIFEAIFQAQRDLREIAPEFRWAGLGNMLGDYGEYVAIERYNLIQATSGLEGYDALTQDGKRVQIKANHSAKQIGFRGEADLLLVLTINSSGIFEEVYYGSFEAAKKIANYSSRDNKWMIGIQRLKKLSAETAQN